MSHDGRGLGRTGPPGRTFHIRPTRDPRDARRIDRPELLDPAPGPVDLAQPRLRREAVQDVSCRRDPDRPPRRSRCLTKASDDVNQAVSAADPPPRPPSRSARLQLENVLAGMSRRRLQPWSSLPQPGPPSAPVGRGGSPGPCVESGTHLSRRRLRQDRGRCRAGRPPRPHPSARPGPRSRSGPRCGSRRTADSPTRVGAGSRATLLDGGEARRPDARRGWTGTPRSCPDCDRVDFRVTW